MSKTQTTIGTSSFLIVLLASLFLLLSSSKLGAFRASTSKQKVKFPVVSLIADLVVVDVKVADNNVLLSVRNDSSKSITAISLSSSGVNYRSDMLDTDEVMAPGATRTEQCGLPSATRLEKGITVLAVVYDDGTSEGYAQAVRQILDVRAGTQAQVALILPMSRDVLTSTRSTRLTQERAAMMRKLELLPEDEEGKSFEFRLGLHDAKERAMNNLRQIEQILQDRGEDVTRQVIRQIVAHYERRPGAVTQDMVRMLGRGKGGARTEMAR